MGLFDSAAFKITEEGLDAAWYKQQVISNNIANVSTPDYKAQTVNFGLVLKEKMKCQYHGRTSCPHDSFKSEEGTAQVSGSSAASGSSDDDLLWVSTTYETDTSQLLNGNNVDIEKEGLDLVDVQYQYKTMIDYMNSQYSMIRTAIGK
jgi:flagellar basal-body rod protein FlgB